MSLYQVNKLLFALFNDLNLKERYKEDSSRLLEKRLGMLREPQDERKYNQQYKTPSVRPEIVEGLRKVFQQPATLVWSSLETLRLRLQQRVVDRGDSRGMATRCLLVFFMRATNAFSQ